MLTKISKYLGSFTGKRHNNVAVCYLCLQTSMFTKLLYTILFVYQRFYFYIWLYTFYQIKTVQREGTCHLMHKMSKKRKEGEIKLIEQDILGPFFYKLNQICMK